MMKNSKSFVFIWFVCLLVLFMYLAIRPKQAVTQSANEYYVATTGSDSNDGSQAHPWKTIPHAFSSFVLGSGGVIIHVANGTYGTNYDITRGGASGQRVTVQCDNGMASYTQAQGKCMLTGGGYVFLFEGSANWIDVIGFDIGGNGGMNVAVDFPGTGLTSGGHHIHVIGNYIHDMGQTYTANGFQGCLDGGAINGGGNGGPDDTQILRNLIVRIGKYPSPTGGNCAWGIDLAGSAILMDNVIAQVSTGGVGTHGACYEVWANNVVMTTANAFVPGSNRGSIECPGGLGFNTFINNYSANVTNHYFQASGDDCTTGRPTKFVHIMTDGFGTTFKPARIGCDTIVPAVQTQSPTSFFVSYVSNGTGNYHLGSSSIGIHGGGSNADCVSGGLTPCVPTNDADGNPMSSPLPVGAFTSGASSVVSVAPTSLTFPDTFTGTTSAALTLTFSNQTASAVPMTSIVASTHFARTTNCPLGGSIPAGNQCTAQVTFSPDSVTTFNGTVVFTFTGTGSPITVNVSGNGITPSVPAAPTGVTLEVH